MSHEYLPTKLRERSVVSPSGCWLWTGPLVRGYGSLYWQKKKQYAHRVSWSERFGPISPGMQIDHLCRTPACINPDHLEPVTQRTNILRGVGVSAQRARQTHCSRGHEFTEANTRVTSRNQRMCRACHQILKKASRHRVAVARNGRK